MDIKYSDDVIKKRETISADSEFQQGMNKEIEEMIMDIHTKSYMAGCEDMKIRIENMLLQSIIELKEQPILKEDLNQFKIGVIWSVIKSIKEMK